MENRHIERGGLVGRMHDRLDDPDGRGARISAVWGVESADSVITMRTMGGSRYALGRYTLQWGRDMEVAERPPAQLLIA